MSSAKLLFVKHCIEHLSNSCYRFIKENYFAIIIINVLSPSPNFMLNKAFPVSLVIYYDKFLHPDCQVS